MSTTSAKSHPGNGSRSDPNSELPAREAGPVDRSPYQAITISRSYEEVVRQIAALIRNGQLRSGERLPTERELGIAFGVSRGVVREAVKVLGALGLVEARQGSGIYVLNDIPTVTRAFTLSVSPDMKSVERLFEFRRTLEVEAAALAAVRRTEPQLAEIVAASDETARAVELGDLEECGAFDNLFHAAVARASGNPYFEVAVATARQMQQDVVPLISDRIGSVRSAILHHRAIGEAIAAGDPESAARAMAEHIVYTASAVTARLPEEMLAEFGAGGRA
jgi:GntR family transcriptional repressor for pyruvate dehydrogenase complex